MVIEETSTTLQNSLLNLSSLCCIGITFCIFYRIFIVLPSLFHHFQQGWSCLAPFGGGGVCPPKIFQISLTVYKKMTRAPQKLISGPPNYFQQFFKSSSLIQLQIKQKSWSTSNPTSQP